MRVIMSGVYLYMYEWPSDRDIEINGVFDWKFFMLNL